MQNRCGPAGGGGRAWRAQRRGPSAPGRQTPQPGGLLFPMRQAYGAGEGVTTLAYPAPLGPSGSLPTCRCRWGMGQRRGLWRPLRPLRQPGGFRNPMDKSPTNEKAPRASLARNAFNNRMKWDPLSLPQQPLPPRDPVGQDGQGLGRSFPAWRCVEGSPAWLRSGPVPPGASSPGTYTFPPPGRSGPNAPSPGPGSKQNKQGRPQSLPCQIGIPAGWSAFVKSRRSVRHRCLCQSKIPHK